MVITLEPRVTLNSVFELELNLGAGRVELEGCLVHRLRGLAVMGPSEQQLVSCMLQLVLPPFEELAQLSSHRIWVALVHRFFNKSLCS